MRDLFFSVAGRRPQAVDGARRGMSAVGGSANTSALLAMLVVFGASAAEAAGGGGRGGEHDGWQVEAHAQQAYRYRHTRAADPNPDSASAAAPGADKDTSQFLRLYLSGNARDEQDRLRAQVGMSLWGDLDGRTAAGARTGDWSMYNSKDSSVWFDVYSLYGEYRGDGKLATLRGGRQVAPYGVPVTFDGALAAFRIVPETFQVFVFGGRTVHFFEASADLFEDWVGSAGAAFKLSPALSVDFDYRFAQEAIDARNEHEGRRAIKDHDYGARMRYGTGSWLRASLHMRGLHDRLARLGGRAMFLAADGSRGLDLSVDGQPVALRAVNDTLDPYFAILGPSRPHMRFALDSWQDFAPGNTRVSLHGGIAGRKVLKGKDSRFNRDYGRAYLLGQWSAGRKLGPYVSMIAEYHFTATGAAATGDDLVTVGGSLGWESERLRAEAGTAFSRVKYDYYSAVSERTNVRTYYGNLRLRVANAVSCRGRYELDVFDRRVQTFTLTLEQVY